MNKIKELQFKNEKMVNLTLTGYEKNINGKYIMVEQNDNTIILYPTSMIEQDKKVVVLMNGLDKENPSNDETVFCDVNDDFVTYDFVNKNISNNEIKVKIVHNLYNQIINRAINMEDESMESEEDLDCNNNFLREFLLVDYHTCKEVVKFLSLYSDSVEYDKIISEGKFYIEN